MINEVIPVWNEIVYGTSRVTERYAAIHAACALLLQALRREILIDFEPVIHPLRNGTSLRKLPRVFHETGRLTHGEPALVRVRRCPLLEEAVPEYIVADSVRRLKHA